MGFVERRRLVASFIVDVIVVCASSGLGGWQSRFLGCSPGSATVVGFRESTDSVDMLVVVNWLKKSEQ